MEEIYSIFRQLKLPDEITNIILFKHKGIEHPLAQIISNKIRMIFVRKPFYCLDYIKSYMWGLDRSLNILSLIKCDYCKNYIVDLVNMESMKEHKRIFNKETYKNSEFQYSYVYYLKKHEKKKNSIFYHRCIHEKLYSL